MKLLPVIAFAASTAAMPAMQVQASFAIDGNVLLYECLPEHSGGKRSEFCVGYITGVIQMAETAGEMCRVSDHIALEQIVAAVREALELNYEYRSRSAENWVKFTVAKEYCK